MCYVFDLVPGNEAEYEQAHDQIWPEVVEAMNKADISNYSIFRRAERVVAYGECANSIAESMALLEQNLANAEWSAFIRQFMTNAVDERGELLFAHEVWHLPG